MFNITRIKIHCFVASDRRLRHLACLFFYGYNEAHSEGHFILDRLLDCDMRYFCNKFFIRKLIENFWIIQLRGIVLWERIF